jgi:hypothetical protein
VVAAGLPLAPGPQPQNRAAPATPPVRLVAS